MQKKGTSHWWQKSFFNLVKFVPSYLAFINDFTHTRVMGIPVHKYDSINISTHHRSVAVHTDNKFQCTYCGKQFRKKLYLTEHINNVHDQIKHKCDQCGSEYTSRQARNIHIKSAHGNEKYSCTLCDYQTTTSGSLTIHKQSVPMKV